MPQPTPSSVHVDAIMTNVSIRYSNSLYIWSRVFPSVPVVKQSDKYFIFRKGPWFRDEAGVRGPGAPAPRGGYIVANDNYFAENYAFAVPIPDETRDNADAPLRPDINATQFATDKIELRMERLVATSVMKLGVWTGQADKDVNGTWAAGTTNTFIKDVFDARESIRKSIGRRPNTFLMDSKTFAQLAQESTVLDRIKYTGTNLQPAMVTPSMIAAIFGLNEVIIGDTIYSNADEKADGTDFNGVDIWELNAGKGGAFLFYKTAAPALDEPNAGYSIVWINPNIQNTGVANVNGRRVVRWRENSEHQDVVEASQAMVPKVTGTDCGAFFQDTIVP